MRLMIGIISFNIKRYNEWQIVDGGVVTFFWGERIQVDVVSVVTPPDTHASISIAALKAGKHVLCDKPTALDRSEALAMAEAAKGASGQIAWIDHELRFLQTVKKVWCEEGVDC